MKHLNSRNYLYSYLLKESGDPYAGIVRADNATEAWQKVEEVKGGAYYPGTLSLLELAAGAPVQGRVNRG